MCILCLIVRYVNKNLYKYSLCIWKLLTRKYPYINKSVNNYYIYIINSMNINFILFYSILINKIFINNYFFLKLYFIINIL